jgi:predicted ribosomally synthesized peptide with SipW-like signal peptide
MAIVLTAGLIMATGTILGTLAWFTDEAEMTNIFTVGNIEMKLDEHDITHGGKITDCTYRENNIVDGVAQDNIVCNNKTRTTDSNTYINLMPGDERAKDPTITISANSEECYVFVKVVDNLDASVEGSTIINYDIDGEDSVGHWELVDGETDIYMLKETVKKSNLEQEFLLFSNVKIDGTVVDDTNLSKLKGKTIDMYAYAIQTANVSEDDAIASALAHFELEPEISEGTVEGAPTPDEVYPGLKDEYTPAE